MYLGKTWKEKDSSLRKHQKVRPPRIFIITHTLFVRFRHSCFLRLCFEQRCRSRIALVFYISQAPFSIRRFLRHRQGFFMPYFYDIFFCIFCGRFEHILKWWICRFYSHTQRFGVMFDTWCSRLRHPFQIGRPLPKVTPNLGSVSIETPPTGS